ncbi:uncharacterized protein [Typha angustifolia]|uniref:uncharacterized protein isoform X1 n=1 Tax=Typha angustifolia TaxID=59011 RepID=UPI003C30D947
MESTHQLLDSLTSHIALYHSSSSNPNPSVNTISAPRAAVLRWFSSLSAAHRQSSLTVLDPDFVSLLLQMLSRLRRLGAHALFFILPDLPSTSSSSSLPSLLSRRSSGLLSRTASSDCSAAAISDSLLLFSSRDGDPGEDPKRLPPLDAATVAEEFVSDVDRFVEVMDGISGGKFLRGEEGGIGATQWPELSWLKDKGYYSLEAFVANRLEVALRLSWLSSANGGRKGKGGKGGREKLGDAGIAANAFWRKKGCLDWWAGLDPGQKERILDAFLGKAAKSLANAIMKGPDISLRNEFYFSTLEDGLTLQSNSSMSCQGSKKYFRRNLESHLDSISIPSSGTHPNLPRYLKRLLVIQEISAFLTCNHGHYEGKTLFFSTLGSAETVSDYVLRKLRGLLVIVSVNYINLELMGDMESKIIPKNEGKSCVGSHKGKNKCRNSRKLDSGPMLSKDRGCGRNNKKGSSSRKGPQNIPLFVEDNQKKGTVAPVTLQRSSEKQSVSAKNKENAVGLSDCKGRVAKKKNRKKGAKNKTPSSIRVKNSETEDCKSDVPSVADERIQEKLVKVSAPIPLNIVTSNTAAKCNLSPFSMSDETFSEPNLVDENQMVKEAQTDEDIGFVVGNGFTGAECFNSSKISDNRNMPEHVLPSTTVGKGTSPTTSDSLMIDDSDRCNKTVVNGADSLVRYSGNINRSEVTNRMLPMFDIGTGLVNKEQEYHGIEKSDTAPLSLGTSKLLQCDNTSVVQNEGTECYIYNHKYPTGGTSYEWPSLMPLSFTSINSRHLPAATDRLHLDVGEKGPTQFRQSFLPSNNHVRNSSVEGGHNQLVPSLVLPMSFDWPPMVRNYTRLCQNVTGSYDLHTRWKQSSLFSGFPAHGIHINGTSIDNDKKHPDDAFDMYDLKNTSDFADDTESYGLSEEESEPHAFSGRDYNQFFGGGVMYWSPAEYGGTGFSRPPSHSSDDSAWAWHEADMNRAIDDMVGVPGLASPYGTNDLGVPGLASPFESLGTAQQSVGYAIGGNDINGKVLNSLSAVSDGSEEKASIPVNNSSSIVEGLKGDTLPYSMLRPIIVPRIPRRGSRSEFKLGLDHKSPCVPSTRRDLPHIKRPPSPVVLCVPRVPCPPPPSPVGEYRKRGFPIVRSGSSSPKHWGLRSVYSDEKNSEITQLCLDGPEVVWPSWGKKGLSTTTMVQSIQSSLLQDHLITISQLSRDKEHPDVALPLQPPDSLNCPSHNTSLSLMHNLLHEEIDLFCKKVAAENLIRKPYFTWAIKRVTRSLQVLWPRSRTNIFGSNATGLALPTSDVDLVVSLPPVRNLEPIKEAGILEGRNGIKETCLQHAARYLANQEWVRSDSLKTIENTAIPVIMLVAEVPCDINFSSENSSIMDTLQVPSTNMPGEQSNLSNPVFSSSECSSLPMCSRMKDAAEVKSIRLDISFKSPSHTGLQTSELVRELTQQFPASIPLALVLKKFLSDRSLDHSYSGGLSSYCMVLLITRFLQHEHHVGRPISQNLGSLLMDFLYFFGNVFDPRHMRVSIQGSGVYMNRERGHSIDPIHIDDPLYPANNVGRNCFRIHQCIKAFADAYSVLENELPQFSGDCVPTSAPTFRLLRKIITSIDCED